MWSKKERISAILKNELADRPPVSAWRHFIESEHSGAKDLADAMLTFQRKYDWDYMKVQPRAVYYEEAWGCEFDYDDYVGLAPRCTNAAIKNRSDLEKIIELSGTDGVFAEQLEAMGLILGGLTDDTPVFQSIFCPTAILQKLCDVNSIGRYRAATRGDLMVTLMQEEPALVHRALKNIACTMANYVAALSKTGLYGVFYAATGLSRTGYLTREEWDTFVRPYDLIVLEAMGPLAPMLHACGISVNPQWFADYPIRILHWPESAPGNPALVSAPEWLGGIIPMGGCDERLFGQDKAAEIGAITRNTVRRMGKIPFILAPDCSLAINSSEEEIRAFQSAVK